MAEGGTDVVVDRLIAALSVAVDSPAFRAADSALTRLEAAFGRVVSAGLGTASALQPVETAASEAKVEVVDLGTAAADTATVIDRQLAPAIDDAAEALDGMDGAAGRASYSLSNMRDDAQMFALGLVGMATAAGTAMVALAGKIGQADAQAQALGMTLQEYDAYAYTAGQLSVQVGDLSGAFGSLTGQLRAVSEGSEGAVKLLEQLGVSTHTAEGRLRTAADVFPELADGLARIDDEGLRAALRMQALGEGGAKLEPLLRAGSEGMERLNEEAHRVGAVTSPEAVEAAGRLGAAWGRLGAVVRGQLNRALEATEPLFTAAISAMGEFAGSRIGSAILAVGALAGGMAALGVTLNPVTIAIGAVTATLGAWAVLLDEVTVTAEGGDSMLRRLADAFGIADEVIYAAQGSVRLMGAAAGFAWNHLNRLYTVMTEVYGVALKLADLVMPDWLTLLGSDLLGMVPALGGALLHASADLVEGADRGLDSALQMTTGGTRELTSRVASPGAAVTNNSNSRSDNRQITVNVAQTNASPEDIAGAIAAVGGG